MPLVGVNQAADDIIDIISIDIHGSNGTDLMANESGTDNGTLTKRNKAKNEIPENKITLVQLLMNLANSGNEKHVKLPSDLMDLNLIQGNASDNLGLNGSDKWFCYRINKRHQCKCYVTLPKDHFNENVSEVIQSQTGFQNSKVKVIKGINDVPEKTHKVVAIGVHQTISEDDIKTELAKNNLKINKVQRLKFNGQPTRKVVIQFENEQDMKIALHVYSGIYFGRIRIRCESYRTTPQVTQCSGL